MTDAALREVQAANEAFYAAVEAGDLDALKELCCTERELVCVHPAAEPIHGTSGVLRSWALIMANTEYIQFFLTDVQVSLDGALAAVTCSENILTAGDEQAGGFRGGRALALNVFVREQAGWRMWIHQASPVGSAGI
jgi:ketosteroid isomerase-like protein